MGPGVPVTTENTGVVLVPGVVGREVGCVQTARPRRLGHEKPSGTTGPLGRQTMKILITPSFYYRCFSLFIATHVPADRLADLMGQGKGHLPSGLS